MDTRPIIEVFVDGYMLEENYLRWSNKDMHIFGDKNMDIRYIRI